MNNLSIHDMPEAERPRERLLTRGAAAVSNAELLAILLRTGSGEENALHLAQRILAMHNGLHGLAGATADELRHIKGLGSAKIAQVLAAIELGKRVVTTPPVERPAIKTAADAARLVLDMRDLRQEHVRVLLLDSDRRLLAAPTVYIGTVNATVLRTAELFREAITRNCAALVLVHNHPFGTPTPSPEDIDLTRDLIAAGRLLDITIVDHLIIGERDWVSLREMGLAFGQ